jgi:predicted aminopeptidase
MIYRLLLISLLTACSSPAYYLQATTGQLKLMRERQDIQSLLNDPATGSKLAQDLKTAEQIKAFAHNHLDLPDNGSYSSYVEVNGDALVWNVIATEEFSLQPKKWCFPVAGCVPYRGFFKQQKAIDSAARLHEKGMDVIVSPAAAYSTLGWFDDPLLSTMISGSDIRLAAYLFHELAHQRLYVKDDGAFNEAYASFVEDIGVKAWLESSLRQNDLHQWQQLESASLDFTNLIGEMRNKLSDLYLSTESDTVKRTKKTDIFNSLSLAYEQLRVEKWQGKSYYDSWFDVPLNNAKLALYDTYAGGQCAFKELLDMTGGDLRDFHHLATQKSQLQKDERRLWLKQTCVTIVPPGEFKEES